MTHTFSTYMKSALLIIFVVSSAFMGADRTEPAQALELEEEGVRWYTFEEAVELSKKEKKKIFIDVYTDWCGWCKKMDKDTFNKDEIAAYLNENYYPVKLNAEQEEDIVFKGNTFKFVASGRKGYHQLAAALLQNKLSFPSFVILNEDFEIINITPGYQQPAPFHKIITYYYGDYYASQDKSKQFEEEYKSPF